MISRTEARSSFPSLEPWSHQARIIVWDWDAEDAPLVQAYVPRSSREELGLVEAVIKATDRKVKPRPGARAEIIEQVVFVYRHQRDTCPQEIELGDVKPVNFAKPHRHPVGIKVASIFRLGPNGEIVSS